MSHLKHQMARIEDLLTPECGHNPPPIRLVVFHDFLLKKARCICNECYSRNKPMLDQEKRLSVPLQENLKCILCNKAPSRLKRDWNAGCCDNCFYMNKVLEEKSVENQSLIKDETIPDCVIENQLYIGPKESAVNSVNLKMLRISRVIVCCHSIPLYLDYDPSIQYLRLCMDDSLEQNLTSLIPYAFAFIQQGIRNNESILIHCNAGVSRSGAVCVAWLMKIFNLNCDDALSMARLKRDKIYPNSNFIEQLDKLEF